MTFTEEPQTITATAEIVFDAGDGTEGAPYEIATVTDLRKLDAFTRDGLAVAGVCFKQTDDIDFEDAVFNGIGGRNSNTYKYNNRANVTAATDIFRGVYDGNGKTISNITGDTSKTGTDSAKYAGVFNTIQGATIKNLTVNNIALQDSSKADSCYSIVGIAYDSTLTGLRTTGEITANGNYGAIANNADNTVFTACENAAAVRNLNNDHCSMGGMSAYGIAVTYIACTNSGVLSAVAQIATGNPREGGIIGADCDDTAGTVVKAADKVIVFENCVVKAGTVTGDEPGDNQQKIHIGSLIGDAQATAGLIVRGTNIVPNNLPTAGENSKPAVAYVNDIAYATAGEDNTFVIAPIAVGNTYKVVAPVNAATTNTTLFTEAGQTLTLDDTFVQGGLFEGGFAAADDSIIVEQTGTKGGTITFTCKAAVTPAKPGEESEPMDPNTATNTASVLNAQGAAAIALPAAVETLFNGDETKIADYKALFQYKVVPAAEGQAKVVLDLTPAAEGAIKDDLEDAEAEASILNPTEGKATFAAKPGLYYGIAAKGELALDVSDVKSWVMAEGTTVEVTVPTVEGDKAFFKPACSAAPME